jgi:hypothetical protein
MKEKSKKLSGSYKRKRFLVKTSMLALGFAFESVSRHAPELKAEISEWEDGFTFSLGVLPGEPAITLKKEGDRIRYLGAGYKEPQVKILFKNIDSAILPFTGQIGTHTAFVQHRNILHGGITEGVQIARALGIVQTYLMPGFVLKKTFKRPPKLSAAQMLLKARLLSTVGFGILLKIRK